MSESKSPADQAADDFSRRAQEPQVGLIREFADYLVHCASLWTVPIVLVLLALGALVWVAGSSAAPLLYSFW